MKPVFQTRYGDGHGNCFQAALASILELDLEEVPDFMQHKDWEKDLNEWLYERFRAIYVPVEAGHFQKVFHDLIEAGVYYIQVGPNHDGVMHCVVAQYGEMIHNPNKKCAGLTEVKYCEVLAFLNLEESDGSAEREKEISAN